MHSMFRAGIAVVGLLVIGLPFAQESRVEHAAHEHGRATGTLAEDAGRWQLDLELPGYNLVGFEHLPRSEPQHRRLRAVLATLESARWLRPEPDSNCRVDAKHVDTTGFGDPGSHAHEAGADHATHHHDEHEHEHEYEYEHEHGETGHGHAAFQVSAVILCDSSRRMRWLELDLFDGFPDNRAIRLDVLSESGAASHELTPDDFRIRLD